MMISANRENAIDLRLAEVLQTHFDPKWGSPYWLERAKTLGFDPREEILSVANLPRMGLMDAEDLCGHPLEHFVPKRVLQRRADLIVAQTGGTLGRPVWTAYSQQEFEEAFVTPFLAAAEHVGFPQGGNWLYVGPSGPHIIARAADAIARKTGSSAPFSVDFDSGWAKKLPAGSFGAGRYVTHVIEQALAVLQQQDISVLFTTPPLLAGLSEGMTNEQRQRIRGVHYGGVALAPDLLRTFQQERFPNAVHLSGYGNTLFGCCLELNIAPDRPLHYFPHGDRLIFGTVPAVGDEPKKAPRYDAMGERCRLVFSRLDHSVLLLNLLERDEASLIAPPCDVPDGFRTNGIAAPEPAHSWNLPSNASYY